MIHDPRLIDLDHLAHALARLLISPFVGSSVNLEEAVKLESAKVL
jgi:hypothetical protein